MLVHTDIHSLPPFKNAVITTGTFDGVHLGHQKLIEKIKQLAAESGGESVLITFEPHPRTVVFPADQSLKLLSDKEEKIMLLSRQNIDHLVIIPFTKEFSQLTAGEYVSDFLVKYFKPGMVVIGYNHQFGHHRDGNVELLRKLSSTYHFKVEEISRQMVDDINISSTRIRIALQEGDVKIASRQLGYDYSLSGTVVKGNQLGRKLGYPTANIAVKDAYKLIPADGVYAVRCETKRNGQIITKNAVCSIGFRPTINGTVRTIEAYIFDFNENIYDQQLKIIFIDRIREEKKFDTIDLMVKEIKVDVEKTKRILN